MSLLWWIIATIVGIIIFYFIVEYNTFIRKKNQIKNAYAQIDVQLKRRHDLIPKLVDTVKGYMKYEKNVLTEITEARTAMMKANDVKSKSDASTKMSHALKSLFAVAEKYPDLKANQNFMQLQEEISGTENKIAYARQFYNDSVLFYNNKIEMFPSNLVAKMMGLKKEEMFQANESDKADVNINMDINNKKTN